MLLSFLSDRAIYTLGTIQVSLNHPLVTAKSDYFLTLQSFLLSHNFRTTYIQTISVIYPPKHVNKIFSERSKNSNWIRHSLRVEAWPTDQTVDPDCATDNR